MKKHPHSAFAKEAPFIEVDGIALRWDPMDVTNSLLGSVNDSIYQGAKYGLGDIGITEPKMRLVVYRALKVSPYVKILPLQGRFPLR